MCPVLFLLALACSGGADPGDATGADAPAPDVDVAPVNPDCPPCPGLVGTALRVTSLVVTSPDAPDNTTDDTIRDFLTEMWERDLQLGLINMLLVVRRYDPVAGVYEAEGGSAWLHPDGKWHFICGYHWPVVSTIDAATCTTDSAANPSTVAFHAGPGDRPNTCAPDGDPPNAITLTDVVTHGVLHVDCANRSAWYQGATLQGWIHKTTADGLCACLSFDDDTGAYTCDRTPDPAGSNFCFERCGKGFALVGTVFEKAAKVPVVAGPDGIDSYPLGGVFAAETVPNFAEGCCRGVDDCD